MIKKKNAIIKIESGHRSYNMNYDFKCQIRNYLAFFIFIKHIHIVEALNQFFTVISQTQRGKVYVSKRNCLFKLI